MCQIIICFIRISSLGRCYRWSITCDRLLCLICSSLSRGYRLSITEVIWTLNIIKSLPYHERCSHWQEIYYDNLIWVNTPVIIVHRKDVNIWQEVNLQYNRKKVNTQEHHDQKVQKVYTTSFKWTSLNRWANICANYKLNAYKK